MTDQTNLDLIWASTGGVTDPGDTKYSEGWIQEIPTFQNFNFVLQALTKNTLSLAESGSYDWESAISYEVNAVVLRTGVQYYCIVSNSNVDPATDATESYWLKAPFFGIPSGSAKKEQGLAIRQVNTRTGTNWNGSDLTVENTQALIQLNTSNAGQKNWLIGNVGGDLVAVDAGTNVTSDGRSIVPSTTYSHKIFHEGFLPSVGDISGAVGEAPIDGKIYGRMNANWTPTVTTSVSNEPPPASTGAGTGWYNLNDGQFYLDINDGDSAQWVPANPPQVGADAGQGAGVQKLIAGTNITLSPASGLGDVTINASGGGSSDFADSMSVSDATAGVRIDASGGYQTFYLTDSSNVNNAVIMEASTYDGIGFNHPVAGNTNTSSNIQFTTTTAGMYIYGTPRLQNPTPTLSDQIASKAYVDAAAGGGGGLPLTGGTLTGPLEVNNSSTGSGTKPTITIRDSERAVTDPFGNYALLEFTDSNDFQYFSIEKNGPFDVGGGVNIKTQGNRHLLLQGDDKILYTTAFGWKTQSDFWVGRSNLDDTVELHVEGANAGIITHLDSSYGKISMTNIGGGAPQNKIRMQQHGSVELWNQTSSSANAQRKLITDGSGITITGRVLVSTLTPTAPGDLTTKSYVDTAIASGGGGGAAWGGITGTLSAQTDLQSALDAKLSLTGGAITGDVTFDSGNFIIQDGNNTTKLLNSNGYNSFRSYSSGGSERLLMSMQRNAGIVLYHGGAQMLTTTTNGISITGRAITNLTTPVTANELTSKDYVDTAIAAAGGGGAAWGGITGTLSAQTDLQSALDAKLSLTGGTVTGNLIVDSSTANFRMIDGNDQLRLIHGGTSTSFKTYSSGTAGQDMLTFQRTGGVNLYFSNVLKLKTTTDGIEVDGSVSLGAGSPSWSKGTGDPTGVVAAPVGSMWSRTDGGTGTTLYVKESGGGGNSGWVAK